MFRLGLVFITIILVFAAPKESINIMEDLPIGTAIYTFSTNGCRTVNHTGMYRFVDRQKNSNDFFLINPYTGRVTTKKLIDRDEFCLRRICSCAKCQITLEVLCVNLGEIFFNDLSIVVEDRNDHAPQFPKSSLTIDVLENVPVGYLIPIDIALDLDYGNNSIQGYRLSEKNISNKILQAFQVEYAKKNDLLALRLMTVLDRESCHSLEYTIEAYDGGEPEALQGRLNIHINILDVNDMSPVFDRADIHVLLSESTTIGSLVARVHAYDRDAGLNGLVYYTMVSLDPPSNGTFILSKETGDIRLGKRLDYEKEKSYRMKVKAQDNGPQQGSTTAFAIVNIEIKDANDNYPLITPTFNDDRIAGVEHLLNSSMIKIRENLPNGTFLGHISISDLDRGNNGRISWSLESNGSISIKELFNNEAFLMFTSRKFDREQQSRYEVSLQAHDYGDPALSSTLNFTLVILDENDNAPKFEQNFYVLNITETTARNSKLLRFHAIDPDQEKTLNSQIQYRLNDQMMFSLNSTTGELYLIGELDREKKSSYELEITASDYGHPQSLSSTVRCLIHLLDINDNYPLFDSSEYTFEIPETWSHLSPIGHVHAIDADEFYGQLSYTLVHNETTMTDQWPFELTSNGTIYLVRTSEIDYEHRSIYQFLIVAIDNAGLSTNASVTIHIQNRNDFCPELLNNSTALFFNTDLWSNHSNDKFNQYEFYLFDGDNDTCMIELLNLNEVFQLQLITRNEYLLSAHTLPEREYYILQFQIRDLVNESIDQACIRSIQIVLTIGNNETNQTVAIDTAREYLEALLLISQRSHAYFNLTVFNVILILILVATAILIAFVSLKYLFRSSNSRHRRKPSNYRSDSNTLYRLQGPTETQLPLLANEPTERSLTSSLIFPGHNQSIQDENADDQQQHLLCQLNSNKYKQFLFKSSQNNTYDIMENVLNVNSPPSAYYPHVQESNYQIPKTDQRRFSSSNINRSLNNQLLNRTYPDSSLTTVNTISRNLKTFSYIPTTNTFENDSSTMAIARLAEQEVIEV